MMGDVTVVALNDRQRLALIDFALGLLRGSVDPRAPEAIVEYERQRAEVAARMAVPAGQAQVVGLHTVNMLGSAPS